MHTQYTLVLSAILGGYLTNAAQHRGALITPAPSVPDLVPRQDQQCDVGSTTCADSYGGCCPAGQACTASQGVPACGGTCGVVNTICPDGVCCNLGEQCILSTGNYYCSGAGPPIPTVAASSSMTYAQSTTSDEGSNTLVLPLASSSTNTKNPILPSGTAGSGSSTSAVVIMSTSRAAGDTVSTAGPWTAGVLAWLTGLLMIA